MRWPSSVCNQCCYSNMCGYLWTPTGRTEWKMDTRNQDQLTYSFAIAGDY